MRRYLQSHPWVTDGLVAGFYLLMLVLGLVLYAIPEVEAPLPPLEAILPLGVIGVGAVLLRRVRPWIAFGTMCVLFLISAFVNSPLESIGVLLTVYALGVYRSSRAAWLAFAIGSVVGMITGLVEVLFESESNLTPILSGPVLWLNLSIPWIVLMLIATLLGTNVGGRKRYVAALLDRAAQLARERDQQAEIASAQERERIAREMHDVIAHSLSVMIALAEGAAATPDRDRSKEAMVAVAETGRRTLGEVRRLLAAVRTPGSTDARTPQPRAEDLPTLVAEFARAGLPVTLEVTGESGTDPALELTVYRIVQESLTNVLRHGADVTEVTVRIEWTQDVVSVLVEDDGRAAVLVDGGRGLLGMRERAALYDGTAEAGPRERRGWRVRVVLHRKEKS